MICDTKNEEDVTYLKVRPFLMDGPNDMLLYTSFLESL